MLFKVYLIQGCQKSVFSMRIDLAADLILLVTEGLPLSKRGSHRKQFQSASHDWSAKFQRLSPVACFVWLTELTIVFVQSHNLSNCRRVWRGRIGSQGPLRRNSFVDLWLLWMSKIKNPFKRPYPLRFCGPIRSVNACDFMFNGFKRFVWKIWACLCFFSISHVSLFRRIPAYYSSLHAVPNVSWWRSTCLPWKPMWCLACLEL